MRINNYHDHARSHVSTACYLAGVVRLFMPITPVLCKYSVLLSHVVPVLSWTRLFLLI